MPTAMRRSNSACAAGSVPRPGLPSATSSSSTRSATATASAAEEGARHLSVAYLGLVKEAQPAPGAAWINAYDLLPWEDRRAGMPAIVSDALTPALARWAGRDAARRHRVRANFGDRRAWDPIRVLERYELLYEAGLVPEFERDRGSPPRRRAAARD